MIFKQIYLTRSWDCNPEENEPGSNSNKEAHIPQISRELEPYYQMQFSVIPRTPLFGGALPFYSGYIQYILSPTDKVDKLSEETV